jgi:hypothetical protein
MPVISLRGGDAVFDEKDLHLIKEFKGVHINENGYVVGYKYQGKKIKWSRLHRIILDAKKGFEVDHINGNRADNRRCNIRLCTVSQNRRNCGLKKHNKVGLKGVERRRDSGGFTAYIRVDGKKKYLGSFPTAIDAARAFDKAAIQRDGEFARINGV